ncbi:hypothetical protein C1Y63_10015 [Corynebacterium sp. 13CS0277]|uniref:hypothetical protein n=1 Tax=Corynebacterium sp. 13CS0277 TaxID=2071994 RepID=UPI000D0382DF|nr:hypothetical protein [Corynebacterium sp. 13CS0277]PRQ10703.1 hypothetical protein C1Y63_10015 [Corynebacterium sp. 13CS0277]
MSARGDAPVQPGWVLWARHHRLPQNTLAGICAAVLVRLAVHLLLESNGELVEVGALWVSIAGALPLVFVFSHDTPSEVCAARSLAARRSVLVATTVTAGLLIALLTYPTNVIEFGMIAVFRNILAFIGLGLLGVFVLGSSWVWVLPLAAAAASMVFAFPQYPTTWHTVYGMLRSPGVLSYPDGTIDASIPLALALALPACGCYIAGLGAPTGRARAIGTSIPARRTGAGVAWPRLIARGWRRATLFWPAVLITALGWAVSLLTDRGSWAGSPRLVGQAISDGWFLFGGLALTLGVIMGQARWRTGVAVWERISGLSYRALATRPVLCAVSATVVPLLVIAAVALAVNTVFLHHHGVPTTVIHHEVLSGARSVAAVALTVAVLAAAGAAIGVLRRGVWVPPLVFIVGIAVILSVFRFFATPLMDHRAQMTTCVPIEHLDSQLCSTPANAPFLPAAATTVGQLYEHLPAKEHLPARIYLVDNVTAHVDEPMARIGLYKKRTLTDPEHFASSEISFQLTHTITDSCRDVPREVVFSLLSPQDGPPRDDRVITEDEFVLLRQCLEETTP